MASPVSFIYEKLLEEHLLIYLQPISYTRLRQIANDVSLLYAHPTCILLVMFLHGENTEKQMNRRVKMHLEVPNSTSIPRQNHGTQQSSYIPPKTSPQTKPKLTSLPAELNPQIPNLRIYSLIRRFPLLQIRSQ